jgi:murein DD-endopeptidase MepM/ murein hydrolase activator NlpD
MSLSQKSSQRKSQSKDTNFVLISSKSFSPSKIFGDIVPVYKKNEIVHKQVTKLSTIPKEIKSLISKTHQFTLRNYYTKIVSVVGNFLTHTLNLCNRLKSFYLHIVPTISSEKGRSFLVLETKLTLRYIIQRLKTLVDISISIFSRIYLFVIICVTLLILTVTPSNSSVQPSNNSFLQRFIQNNSVISNASPKTTDKLTNVQTNTVTANTPKIQKITLHETKQGETKATIADLYGLNMATVVFNNNLQNELVTGQKLYLPWVDGYIYNATEDINPDKITEIYGIDKGIILDENSGNYDQSQNIFHKDSLILIPTTDFEKVQQANDNENAKKKAKQAEEERNRIMQEQKSRNLNIANQAIPSNKVNTSNISSESRMIWPTTGSISRCYSSGHKGCDIANFSAPQILAAKSGVIVQVSRYQVVGYGLMVRISHGNGQETLYAHMQDIYVQEGQAVTQGQAIGQMGSTGYSTGTHLHFEVHENNVQVDPLPYLP